MKVKTELLELMKKYSDHHWVQETIDNENVHPSYVGRLVSEYDIAPLDRAWYRVQCTDKQFREWEQPYYANNPHKARLFEKIN